MYTDIFSRIKDILPMRDVAEHYGLEINRSGDTLCPFHNDSSPSMHIYPGTRGWWCFVCNEGGDVIDFVKKLYHINARQAAIRLDNDFHLGLTTERVDPHEVSREILERKRKQAALDAYRSEYDAKSLEAQAIRFLPKPPPSSPLWGEYAALMGRLDYLDNYYFAQNKWR